MKIAVIGAGRVGSTLGMVWSRKGHEVIFGVRNPQDPAIQDAVNKAGGSLAANIFEALQAANVILLATPWRAIPEVMQWGVSMTGKILLDASNPLTADLSGLEIGTVSSGAEKVAEWADGGHVVKIFNTTGFGNMADPIYNGKPITMFYCGDNAEAKAVAAQLAADAGFEPIDVGPLSQARLLEPLAALWIGLASRQGLGRDIAICLVKR